MKKRAYKRQIQEIISNGKLNNLSTDDLTTALCILVDGILEHQEEFIKKLMLQINPKAAEWVEELHEAYPQYLSELINGHSAPAKGLANHSMEDLSVIYLKHIKNDAERHKQIKELVNFGVKHKLIKLGFYSFVVSRDWERLETESLKINSKLKGGYGLRKAT